jgi:hypothetical protein
VILLDNAAVVGAVAVVFNQTAGPPITMGGLDTTSLAQKAQWVRVVRGGHRPVVDLRCYQHLTYGSSQPAAGSIAREQRAERAEIEVQVLGSESEVLT